MRTLSNILCKGVLDGHLFFACRNGAKDGCWTSDALRLSDLRRSFVGWISEAHPTIAAKGICAMLFYSGNIHPVSAASRPLLSLALQLKLLLSAPGR